MRLSILPTQCVMYEHCGERVLCRVVAVTCTLASEIRDRRNMLEHVAGHSDIILA